MPEYIQRFYVFLSSPGDTTQEREISHSVISILTDMLEETAGIAVRVVDWSRMVPGVGETPQAVIDQQIPDYDIYVGIMRSRYGTIGKNNISNTEYEYKSAIISRSETGKPESILFYFYRPKEDADIQRDEQQLLVDDFKKRISSDKSGFDKAMLYKEYESHENFKDVLLVDLYKSIIKIADADTAISHYRSEIEEDKILSEYIDILNQIDAQHDQFRNIRLYIIKSKGEFLKELNEIAYRQGLMNNTVYSVAYELDVNRNRYLTNRKMLSIKLRNAARAYDKFSNYTSTNWNVVSKHWYNMIVGLLLFGLWLRDNPDTEIADYDQEMKGLEMAFEEMGATQRAIREASVKLEDLASIGGEVKKSANRARKIFKMMLGSVNRWREQLNMAIMNMRRA